MSTSVREDDRRHNPAEGLPDDLGDDIQRAREARGVSKKELARQFVKAFGGKTGDMQITRWEAGQGIKALDLLRLATLLPELRVNLRALLGRAIAKGDPGYEGWSEFMRSGEAAALADEELEILAVMPWPEESDPSAGDYQMALRVIRGARRKPKLP